jgi:hypothetical protein
LFCYFFNYYLFYLIVIITTSLDNNYNSFININNFNLDKKGANIKCLKDNNINLIILLSNTSLETILKEDKEDRLEYSPK